MGKQKADQDNYTVDTDPSYELVLNRQSTGDYSNCSTITFEMLGFKTSILDNMRGYNQYGEDYKREEPNALPYSTSHTKSSMDSELSGLEISTPVMGNRQKVGATSEMEGFNMPFDPHDDTSVLEEELNLLEDDGLAYQVFEQEGPSEDMLPKSSSSAPPPPPAPPAPPAEVETPTMGNGRNLPVTSTHTFASEVVSDASFVVEELELADEEDEFTWKTISTKNMQYFLDAAKQYGDNVVINESTDRTNRQSNRTSDANIDYAALGMLEDEIYGDAAVSSGLGEDAKQKSLDEAIKEEDESKTLKKKRSSRKLKKDSSSRSKRLVCADTEAVGDISSPKSLKQKSSSRKLLKKASSKKLKKEPSSKKLKKEKSSRGLKKEPSSRSKKLAESQDAESSRTVQKSNSRTSKLLKSKSSSKRSSRKKLLAVGDDEDSSKKSKSNLRDKLLRKSSSKRTKKKQKLTEEDAASPPSTSSSRPTLKKKKSKSSRRKIEESSGSVSRSPFTQTATRRLSSLIRVSFTKDQ